jgi:hypothetical protein
MSSLLNDVIKSSLISVFLEIFDVNQLKSIITGYKINLTIRIKYDENVENEIGCEKA